MTACHRFRHLDVGQTEEKCKTTGSIKTKPVRQRSCHVAYRTSSKAHCRIVCFRPIWPARPSRELYPKRKNCIRLYQSPGPLVGHFWAFFRRSKPKKIQKSSEKHTLISFDSFQITPDIVRSLRCFYVFTSFRWYVRRLANTFIRQKHSVMPYRSIAWRQHRVLYGVWGILTHSLRFRCHDEANTVFNQNPRNRYRSRSCP